MPRLRRIEQEARGPAARRSGTRAGARRRSARRRAGSAARTGSRAAWRRGAAASRGCRAVVDRDARRPGTRGAAAGCTGAAARRTAGGVVLLGHAAAVHHDHAIADLGDDPEVVGDEDDAHPEVAGDAAQQLEDLGLDHHVERGRRLVGDDHVGVAGQRQGDHRALPHAAGVGVRILASPAAGRCPPARGARRLGRASALLVSGAWSRIASRSGRRRYGPG